METLEVIGKVILVIALIVVAGFYYTWRFRRFSDSIKTEASKRNVRRSRKFWGG